MAGLFDPASIGTLRVKNRFVRSATEECMADPEGRITPRLIAHHSRLAKYDVGLLVTGGAYVHPTGRSFNGVSGIHDDALVPDLVRLTEAVHAYEASIVMQLYHCGRQGEPDATGGILLAPSALASRVVRIRPRAMSEAEIVAMVASFGEAAARAKAAGFDGVQILAANGYLINQFLSPNSNHRQDEWGGSLPNRMRFLLEVFHAVRSSVGPDFPVLVKLPMNDHVRGGFKPDEALIVANELAARGVNAIEVTGGTLESFFYMSRGDIPVDQILRSRPANNLGRVTLQLMMLAAATMRGRVKFEEAYFADHARMVKRATGVPVMLVGGLRSPLVMDQLIREGTTDFVSLSRAFLREPTLVRRIANGDMRPSFCTSCNRCLVSVADGGGVRCFGGRRGSSQTQSGVAARVSEGMASIVSALGNAADLPARHRMAGDRFDVDARRR
jgi:2,4-dienoyl-CoA reductase-like NADH-dependent reductase (Old Yellow Enzyme family)